MNDPGRLSEDLLPVLAITRQQLIAIANPAVPFQSLAEDNSLSAEIAGRPIRIWAKDPSIARRINDALEPRPI